MNNNINEIIEQSNVFFDNSENIFISFEWALAQIIVPKIKVGSYDFPFNDNVENSVKNANKDLLLYGETFLKGDLSVFYEARKKINQKRQPYKIHKRNENGVYVTENEPLSVEKKKKYS